jgi:hypothetical protein
MSLIKEDWERVHLNDEMYMKEMEYLEMEHYKYGDQKPPAKIKTNVKHNTGVRKTIRKSKRRKEGRKSTNTSKRS